MWSNIVVVQSDTRHPPDVALTSETSEDHAQDVGCLQGCGTAICSQQEGVVRWRQGHTGPMEYFLNPMNASCQAP